MRVRILRKKQDEEEQYWEDFDYSGPVDISVAGMLDELNYRDDVTNSNGEIVPRIRWSCSCLTGICGACAMVINGEPALACSTFVRDLGDSVTLEPLSKFPCICDLTVDRDVIHEDLKKADAAIKEYKGTAGTAGGALNAAAGASGVFGKVAGASRGSGKAAGAAAQKEFDQQYQVARCLKCGLCLEVCPGYVAGSRFYGALFANDCYLIWARSGVNDRDIKKQYADHFAAGCSKSFACVDVCPMKIPTLASMAKLNR